MYKVLCQIALVCVVLGQQLLQFEGVLFVPIPELFYSDVTIKSVARNEAIGGVQSI